MHSAYISEFMVKIVTKKSMKIANERGTKEGETGRGQAWDFKIIFVHVCSMQSESMICREIQIVCMITLDIFQFR